MFLLGELILQTAYKKLFPLKRVSIFGANAPKSK